ncbi:MAG: response regulator transcription factor [Bacteroidota bacterium]|nr:response regulator transcription factor [Bacteroidota bacterium]MDP4234786.1 response regulator transcription factor [Bacteroidota bacterium]MDP4244134.1 response regulator transcription factor [Bacteroidota bacterium]MDP4289310.1 response regulator transcription factor [Bacteroidota bacterium]
MKRPIYLYALAMAGLLVLLKSVEYRYLVYDLQTEYFVGIIALFFTVLGLWIGWRLTAKKAMVTEGGGVRVSALELGISPREEEVLRLIAAGHSNQEIADKMFLSLNTVKKHTGSLLRKLEAERRTQAIERARKLGLIE